jgi:RNA polymerase sigma factor (sigma-70 family)
LLPFLLRGVNGALNWFFQTYFALKMPIQMPNPQFSNQTNDNQLWEQMKVGSELALGKLIKKYFNFLQNYGYKFIKDEAFVKDCVQEVFIDLWTHRERVTTPLSIKAYLLTSVRRRVLREAERQQKYRQTDDYDLENEGEWVAFSQEWLLIEQESLSDMTQKVSDLLNQLPRRQREVLYLRFYQNMERTEIAQIMDINEQSVSNHLQAAFKNFKENWESLLVLMTAYFLNL